MAKDTFCVSKVELHDYLQNSPDALLTARTWMSRSLGNSSLSSSLSSRSSSSSPGELRLPGEHDPGLPRRQLGGEGHQPLQRAGPVIAGYLSVETA